MTWRVTDTGPGDPAWNMAVDDALLENAATLGGPVLRFYGWTQPAATFGYFQRHADIAAWTPLRPLIRRPTGGGLVSHAADWTYSIVIPPGDPWHEARAADSYLRLHQWLAASLRAANVPAVLAPVASKEIPGQCFAGAEQSDVLLDGRKIAGAAQRRTRCGLLIQGSVQNLPAGADRPLWQAKMIGAPDPAAPENWVEWSLPQPLLARAGELADQKYSSSSHNQRR